MSFRYIKKTRDVKKTHLAILSPTPPPGGEEKIKFDISFSSRNAVFLRKTLNETLAA